MSLASGARLGTYEILGLIGAGGMGEVYRARDLRLQRDVALKTLPAPVAQDTDRLQRFKREAQVLASLNHTNIAAIYGLEESNGVSALVLELVEGPTLADRIAERALSIDEAVPVARQIAEALDAAHEQGIVHRDLKPANIKLRPDGTVKVLDFGLAKALQPAATMSPDVAVSPTITSPALTQLGVILGTAAYMSPEQAKARAATKRSDIWAFGAVLFEILSGQRAFQGDDVAETLASVLRQDIDWNALPPTVPAPVRRLIARCLERDEKRRLRDIGEARIVLEGPLDVTPEAAPESRHRPGARAMPLAVAALAGGILAAAATWYAARTPPQPAPLVRLSYPLPTGQSFNRPAAGHSIALSPDGDRIVYAANNRLYIRTLSGNDDRAIAGTEGHQTASSPVFSPDGQSVIFFAAGDRTLRRIAAGGGASISLGTIAPPFGMSWSERGILVGQGANGVIRVSPDGGAPEVMVRVKDGEEAHGPQLMPDGRHLLFTIATGTDFDKWDRARLVVQEADSETPRTLLEGAGEARFEPATDQLFYVDSESLLARPFDAQRLEFTGSAVPVGPNVWRSSSRLTGAANFGVSSRSLIYVRSLQQSVTAQEMEIRLTTRNGKSERLNLPAARYSTPRVSPDGKRLAVGVQEGGEARIAVYELSGTSSLRMLTLKGNSRHPIWFRDGTRLTFQSDREGDLALYQATIDGGAVERLTKPAAGEAHEPEEWSPTSDTLLFTIVKGRELSLWTYTLPARTVAPFGNVRSASPTGARFSRDGRWVAYSVRGAERSRIHVQPFPTTGEVHELAIGGNNIAAHKIGWSADDKELFYIPRIREFEVVRVTTRPIFRFGEMTKVQRPFENPGAPTMRTQYDITPSGKFVGLFPPGDAASSVPFLSQIEVVLNWPEQLRQR